MKRGYFLLFIGLASAAGTHEYWVTNPKQMGDALMIFFTLYSKIKILR
jgi:hypothetical protein